MKPHGIFRLLVVLWIAVVSVYSQHDSKSNQYLFVWAGDGDGKDDDFLAVVDARRNAPTYGEIIATLPVGAKKTAPHHTEYEFPESSVLLANGWGAGRTFLIDLRDPRHPKLAGEFKDAGAYSFPHSFARLPNGNFLATFQVKTDKYEPPGALVELDASGRLLRAQSSDVVGLDKRQLWPYSLLTLPKIDRVVTTSTEMGLPKWATQSGHAGATHDEHTLSDGTRIQIWSISKLQLLHTIPLPARPGSNAHLNPAEPRLLDDGTVYVNTFNCGLYRVIAPESPSPKAEFVYAFPGADKKGFECGVPVAIGRFWIQTDPSLPGLIALDVSDSAKPVEVSRLVFDKRFEKPHWVAADRKSGRIVVTGNHQSWVLIVNIDARTGRMSLDERFKAKGSAHPGIDFDREQWPHGATGKAVVHGSLFGPLNK